ncbi:M14 family metallopeptidase [Phenylobacterium sp.]|uniref:M14 family metallopeptidase n=1 Tax=Phenylobacterium sp. TaxID=1871053 RepID=UPI0025F6F8FE|nr:M14 family metallopeptidase [Phenylobacterium sp.]MBX3485572.1 M14 family metallopeptidase [Phenylobacterium sp.]
MSGSPFSATYAEARDKFLAAARGAGASLSAYVHPERGPDGGELATDVAWIGPTDARAVFVMVSATHGVEGHCGSGAQIDWLRRGEAAHLPAGAAALIVHAINPYGFAWSRRVTHENVDLNRNFVDFGQPLPQNPNYDALHHAVKPADWSEATQAASRATLLNYARTHGFPALVQAMSGGQYSHADGIFYGGREPTWSRRTLETIFRERLAAASDVGVIDYHTGLGPWGYAEPIASAHPASDGYRRAREWHGLAVTSMSGGESVSAVLAGDWLEAVPRLAPHARTTGVALEYGVVPSNEVLDALRADNWLHAHGDPLSPQGQAIKAQVRAAFYGDDDVWRGMVLGQSLVAARQSMAGLAKALGG